jgi:hypothetical protein
MDIVERMAFLSLSLSAASYDPPQRIKSLKGEQL